MVRPGGTIIFATCSLQPEEGPILIDDFLNSFTNVRRDPLDDYEVWHPRDDYSGWGPQNISSFSL